MTAAFSQECRLFLEDFSVNARNADIFSFSFLTVFSGFVGDRIFYSFNTCRGLIYFFHLICYFSSQKLLFSLCKISFRQ